MASNANPRRSSLRNKKAKYSEKVDSPVKQLGSPESDSGRLSPAAPCAICLGKHENKCFTNNCLHEFCFTCLLEWSKVKPECPLCKQSFTSIIHNVRSNQEYDEHKIPVMLPEEPDLSALDLVHHRFRYRTTLTAERRQTLALERLYNLRQFREDGILPTERRRPMRSRMTGTSTFRRQTYQRDLWVRPLADITGRYRETTPEFFQLNPAMTHRLVPWLNRELNVLLASHENRLAYVLELILRLITQHHIRSRPFREAIQPCIGPYTEHFIHEFFQFARSPYDMYGFDENADYEPRNNLQHEEVAVSESSDEDVPARPIIASRVAPSDIPLPPSPQPGPSGLNRSTVLVDDGQSYGVASSSREDIEIVQIVGRQAPEVITLSDSDDEESADQATSSRGKSLCRKDKRLKSSKKKKKRSKSRERSSEDEPSATTRYWDMDPEEIRRPSKKKQKKSKKDK